MGSAGSGRERRERRMMRWTGSARGLADPRGAPEEAPVRGEGVAEATGCESGGDSSSAAAAAAARRRRSGDGRRASWLGWARSRSCG